MYIRRSQAGPKSEGKAYYTYRLVETIRYDKSVKQKTLMNLGAGFTLPKSEWPAFVERLEDILAGQVSLLSTPLAQETETFVQRCAAQIIFRRGQNVPSVSDDGHQDDDEVEVEAAAEVATAEDRKDKDSVVSESSPQDDPKASSCTEQSSPAAPVGTSNAACKNFQEIDLNSLDMVRPRSVGVEHAALSVARELGLDKELARLGFNRNQTAAALGNIIGRMAAPSSELATYQWLRSTTALGELLGYDYEAMSLKQLYSSADLLLKNRDALETYLFKSTMNLFGFKETITLYDLTNTYFEGTAKGITKGKHARSKEKRSDCPLVTMGLVLDAQGFPKRSRIFEGNVSEPKTLQSMLVELGATVGTTVVMDAGIATEENLAWLKANGYHYIVVSRKRARQFDAAQAVEVITAGDDPIMVQKVIDETTGEGLLYCHSEARAEKEKAMVDKKAELFEAALAAIQKSVTTKRGNKAASYIHQRIGRAKQKYAHAAQHYTVDVSLDPTGKIATAITWTKTPVKGSSLDQPGVYCLRTTLTEPDESAIWHIYVMLTNLEAVFRSLKTDLGFRPVYHRIDRRVEGHLYISVLAYFLVHTLRLKLKACGHDDSWYNLRKILATQQRITVTAQRRDGRTVHLRKATRLEPHQQVITQALQLTTNPGGTRQTIV